MGERFTVRALHNVDHRRDDAELAREARGHAAVHAVWEGEVDRPAHFHLHVKVCRAV